MTDLERALRDTLTDPPVQVPPDRYAVHDIERRIERRRSRQKRTATGLGVAAVIAAAIAVPVATGVDLGSSGSNSADSSSNMDAKGGAVGGAKASPQSARIPAPVRNAANALARDYGRPLGPIEWVRTTASVWAGQRHVPTELKVSGPIYVLQVRDFRCTKGCPPAISGRNAEAMSLVAAVDANGHRLSLTFDSTYNMRMLGTVHTFTKR